MYWAMNARYFPCGLVNGLFTGALARSPIAGVPDGLDLGGRGLIPQIDFL